MTFTISITRNVVLLTLLLSGAIEAIGQTHAELTIDKRTFETMRSQERLLLVKSLLRSREELLQNFSYQLVESSTSISLDDGSRRSHPSVTYSVKRLRASHWMQIDRPGSGPNRGFDSVTNWDVDRAMTLTNRPGRAQPRGMIRDQENSNFVYRAYNQILGFRILENGPPMTVTEWLTQFPNAYTQIEASIEKKESKDLLKINVWEERRHKTFWFDLGRGMLPVRTEYRYQTVDGKGYNKEFSDVIDARQIEGIWVPTKVVRRTGTSASKGETEIVYDVKEFTIGTVRPEDLKILFPPNTEVIDQVSRVAYIVQADGSKRPIRFYDAETGTLKRPISDASVKVVTSDNYHNPDPVVDRSNESYAAGVVARPTQRGVVSRTAYWFTATALAILSFTVLLIRAYYRSHNNTSIR